MARKSVGNPLVFSTDRSHQTVCAICGEVSCQCEAIPEVNPADVVLHMRLERKGRRGKAVTIVYDLPPEPLGSTYLVQLATRLKRHCGTGGGMKNETMEIQGDQRDRVQLFLEKEGFTVRRSGG